MATSIVPALLDVLLSTAESVLPGVIVHDGNGGTEDPGDYLMVGVRDPDETPPTAVTSAEIQQAFGTARPRQETGTIYLTAFSWNGNSGNAGMKAARDAVYAIAATLANALRPNALAVTGLQTAGFGESTTLKQGQSEFGAGAQLTFSIDFRALI